MNWEWIEEHLQPERTRPVPLPMDFDRLIVETNPPPGTKPEDFFRLTKTRQNEAEIQAATEDIVKRNEKVINEAADRIASTSATVPSGEMFHNLISTNFDEAQLLRNAERQLEQKRQAAKNAARRSSP